MTTTTTKTLKVTVKPVTERGAGAVVRTKTKVFLSGGFVGIDRRSADRIVAGVIADLGATGPAKFSSKCGCSCGCSPGWNVRTRGVFDVFVEAV